MKKEQKQLRRDEERDGGRDAMKANKHGEWERTSDGREKGENERAREKRERKKEKEGGKTKNREKGKRRELKISMFSVHDPYMRSMDMTNYV